MAARRHVTNKLRTAYARAAKRDNASTWIIQAVGDLQVMFPFPLVVFDSDNGSEFINHDVADWLQERDIAQPGRGPTRSKGP